MAKKRETPTSRYERLAERIYNENTQISSKDDYEVVFNRYFDGFPMSKSDKANLRENTWPFFEDTFLGAASLYKRAGGKDLKRDKRKTAKIVVDTPEEFIRRGARKVDLRNLDTRPARKGRFSVVGKVNNKIVFTRLDIVKKQSGEHVVYRNKAGQFASVKKKKRKK
jgi:hypothetical protein